MMVIKYVRRFSLILFLLLLTLMVDRPLFAQGTEENWLEAATNGRLIINQIRGKSSFGAHPVLNAELQNPSADASITVRIASGEILQPATPDYCSVLLAGVQEPILLEAGQRITQELTAYCLELPDPNTNTPRRPDEAANYVPLSFSPASEVPSSLLEILTTAREANLLESYATQLAIWQQHANLTDFTELTTRLGQNNLESYRDEVALLTNNLSASPSATETPVTEEANPVVPSATEAVAVEITEAPAEENSDSGGMVRIDGDSSAVTIDTNLLIMAGGLCSVIFGLLLVALFYSSRRSTAKSRTRKQAGNRAQDQNRKPVSADDRLQNQPTISHGQGCIFCGGDHNPRLCPEKQHKRAGGLRAQRAGDTVPSVGPASKYNSFSPSPSTLNQPSNRHSSNAQRAGQGAQHGHPAPFNPANEQATHHTAREEYIKQQVTRSQMNEGDVSTITEPTVLDSSPDGTLPKSDTVPNENPPVTYVISDGQTQQYLNGTTGLLARDDLFSRQIVLGHDSTISTPHAVIRFEKSGHVTVRDLCSTHGTLINGQRLSVGQREEIQHHSRLQFGHSSVYELDLSQRKLRPISPNLREIDLSQEKLWVVTRSRLRKTIQFKNQQLSNPQLLIRPNDPDRPLSFRLRDLGSSNGSFINGNDLRQMVNGTFIAERAVEIKIGKHRYKIEAQWIAMAFKSGQLIGDRYKVEKQIYMGGMSELYLVKDDQSANGQVMAAKLPYMQQYGEDRVRPAFQREIELMTSLKHENLLPAQDSYVGSLSDQSYLIMRYIDGYDLKTLLSRRRQTQASASGLRLVDVQKIFNELLSGVEYLHDEGWIHCDLKPDNILLSKDGEVFLIDLGAATAIGKPASFHNRAYSAPEAGSARVVNEASDIYSLGKILFELLTNQDANVLGRLSMSEASHQGAARQDSTANKQSEDPQRPLGLLNLLEKPPYGRDFAHIISKATSKEPIDRYPDVEALRDALKDVYTRPMSKAALDQEGPINLIKVVGEIEQMDFS